MQTTWFWLLCALWSLYFVTEGFDFGVGMLLPVLGRSEDDRRTMIQAIGPFWDGNEVWLIIAGAATFAAFPVWYATMFSGFYIALLLAARAPDRPGRLVRVARQGGEPALARRLDVAQHDRGGRHPADLGDRALEPAARRPDLVGAGVHRHVLGSLHPVHGRRRDRVRAALRASTAPSTSRFAPPATCTRAPCRCGRRIAVPAVSSAPRSSSGRSSSGSTRTTRTSSPASSSSWSRPVAAVAAVVLARRRREGLAFAATAATIVLAVVLLFTELYPRVMVSSTNFADSLTTTNSSSGHYTLVGDEHLHARPPAGDPALPVVELPRLPRPARERRAGGEPDRPAGAEARPGPTPDRPAAGRRLARVRALDPRLLRRARAARVALVADAVARGRGRAARARAGRPARARRGTVVRRRRRSPTSPRRSCCSSSSSRRARCATWGFETVGAPRRDRRALAAPPRSRLRAADGPARRRSTAPRAPRSQRPPSTASTRSTGCSAATSPARPRRRRAGRRARPRRVARSRLGGADAPDAAARAGLLLADRPGDRAARARALAGDVAALDPLPRRRPRPADAARVQPRRGAGRADRAGRATSTGRRRWGRCGSRSSPGRCSSSPRRSASRSSP